MKTLFLLASSFLLMNTQVSAQNNTSADLQFLELENKWMNAWKNKDLETAKKILADEFTLTSSLSTGELVNKEQWLEKAMHQYHCKDYKFNKVKARVYGNTAVVNSWYYQEATANGKDWSGNFLLTDVWVRKNGSWQVVARHSSWLQNK